MSVGTSTLKAAAATTTLATAAGLTALALAGPASAKDYHKHLGVGCPQPYSQTCSPRQGITVYTDFPMQASFTADANACAPGKVRLFLDGVEQGSRVVQPGQFADFELTPNFPGSHVIEVQMDGVLGGCNTGAMSGWSGDLDVSTAAPIEAPPSEQPPAPPSAGGPHDPQENPEEFDICNPTDIQQAQGKDFNDEFCVVAPPD